MMNFDDSLYTHSLGAALVLMLFFSIYFLVAKTPDKQIFGNYVRSRRIMAMALLALFANYAVHLFIAPRFFHQEAAIMMNLSTYFLSYWLFSCALMILLNRYYLTVRLFLRHLVCWVVYVMLSCIILWGVPSGTPQHIGMALMALWLFAYGIYLSRRLILTYRWAVRLFDDTHSEYIAAYIRWMSIFTWWAVIYGVGCGLLTFLPDKYVFLWILSSIPFYIYLYCSYMNYLLFYEQVERILEKEVSPPAPPVGEGQIVQTHEGFPQQDGMREASADYPSYHIHIKERLSEWVAADGYTTPGLTIEELASTLATNRTYLSCYIKATYHVSFREWIAEMRIDYAKRQLAQHPELTVAAISEASGFLSLSYFTKIFTDKEGCSPSKWRKTASVTYSLKD